jgi:tripartite-type tricarboxylate transporter receptor subunit TctC
MRATASFLSPLRLAALAIVAAGSLLAAFPAQAQYPQKPIRVFLPFAAGGIGDITFRIVTAKISERTNAQFAIENRPGAGGIASAMAGKAAAPDGYSLLQIGNSYTVSASLFDALPYDLVKDFTPIATLAQFDILLATKFSGEIGSLARLIEIDRANPGKLNFGSISPGSTQNLAAEMFKAMTGSQASIVPYKGSPELITALQRGDIDVAFDYLAAFAPALAGNQIRIIASGGESRSPLTPNTPTVIEGGWPGYVVTSWNGIAAPAGTPREIIDKLNREIVAVLNLPDVQERFRQLGMEAKSSTPEGMSERLTTDMGRWRGVIGKLGLRH